MDIQRSFLMHVQSMPRITNNSKCDKVTFAFKFTWGWSKGSASSEKWNLYSVFFCIATGILVRLFVVTFRSRDVQTLE